MEETIFDWKVLLKEVEETELQELELEDVNRVSSAYLSMLRWCSEEVDDVRSSICSKFKDLVFRTLKLLIKLRIDKALRGSSGGRSSVDVFLREAVSMYVDRFVDVVVRGLRTHHLEVLCKVRKVVQLRDLVATPGYIVLLPIELAIPLSIAGYVDVLTLDID